MGRRVLAAIARWLRPSRRRDSGADYYPWPKEVVDLPTLLAACKSPSHRAWHEFAGMQPCTMCLHEFEGWDV